MSPHDLKTLTLDGHQIQSLRAVIAYLYQDESEHFENCEPEEQLTHIFQHVEKLATAIGKARGYI